ncbi:MAG TPA: GntR family transcriptional regulator [Candidatus Eisenbacteria bacterium]|nr:GntR family transcriptional regulator [Candidatus Eisenbacteria bacterium]
MSRATPKRIRRVSAAPRAPESLQISRAPLRSEVRRVLLEHILDGSIAPGTSVNESELALALGVSRTPLREALLGLEREGFLMSETGRGFFVLPLTLRDAEELYPILWTLEGEALAASGPYDAKRLAELRAVNDELKKAEHDAVEALRLDRRWHDVLLRGCDNARLLALIDVLKDQARRYEAAYMQCSGRVILSTRQHEAIVKALEAGDARAAREELEQNWRVSLEFLVPWLGTRSGAPT